MGFPKAERPLPPVEAEPLSPPTESIKGGKATTTTTTFTGREAHQIQQEAKKMARTRKGPLRPPRP